jgi:hypothetical protein
MERQSRRSRNAGIFALIAAAVTIIPGFNDGIANVPVITLGLGVLAVYLLCFRR